MNKNASIKRAFDVSASLAGIVCLAPVFAATALAIRLDDAGPILFKQRRVGLRGETFRILKFRTMKYRDPDKIDQFAETVVSGGADPRITRIGRFLRASSLDELPQLVNVLCGDMSLVGPRPVLEEQLEVIPEGFLRRFDVRPGLTGLAQVRGRRGLDWPDQLEADREYAMHPTLAGDLQILLRTVKVVLKRDNVYAGTAKNWRSYLDAEPDTQTLESTGETSL